MSNDILKDFISLAATSLEAEDRKILGLVRLRGANGGILRLVNERYYQFICWRAAIARWEATVEVGFHDLVLRRSEDDTHFAVFEMKGWWAPKGETEIPDIKSDIEKLKRLAPGQLGFLIVFSGNPNPPTKDENINWLESKIFEGEPPHCESYSFQTWERDGSEREFWIAGWQVYPSQHAPASQTLL